MAKTLSFLFLCLFLLACNKSKEEASSCTTNCGITATNPSTGEIPQNPPTPTDVVQSPDSRPTPAPLPPTGSRVPNEAFTFDANISFHNVTRTQEAKFLKAIEIIKKVVATEEFRSRVINHTYEGRKTYVDNGGFTNFQIYRKILNGAEVLQNHIDNEMDMEVELYTAFNSTVGYTYPDTRRIWVNTKYFNTYTAAGVARNLFHEWLHKLGFKHASSYSPSRNFSVPYAIGNIVDDIGKDFL